MTFRCFVHMRQPDSLFCRLCGPARRIVYGIRARHGQRRASGSATRGGKHPDAKCIRGDKLIHGAFTRHDQAIAPWRQPRSIREHGDETVRLRPQTDTDVAGSSDESSRNRESDTR